MVHRSYRESRNDDTMSLEEVVSGKFKMALGWVEGQRKVTPVVHIGHLR